MKVVLSVLSFIVLSVSAAGASPRSSLAQRVASLHVSSALMAQATHVAVCEEGGWHNAHGPTYFGSLGWLDATWQTFRLTWMPARMDDAPPVEQAWALGRFATRYGMPDLNGSCQGY
jgi:hypothetical protein